MRNISPITIFKQIQPDDFEYPTNGPIAEMTLGCELYRQGLGATWQGEQYSYKVTSPPAVCSTETTAERLYVSELIDGNRNVWAVPATGGGLLRGWAQATTTDSTSSNWSFDCECHQLTHTVSVGFHHKKPVKNHQN